MAKSQSSSNMFATFAGELKSNLENDKTSAEVKETKKEAPKPKAEPKETKKEPPKKEPQKKAPEKKSEQVKTEPAKMAEKPAAPAPEPVAATPFGAIDFTAKEKKSVAHTFTITPTQEAKIQGYLKKYNIKLNDFMAKILDSLPEA